jgi:hypothetical protein
MSKKQEDMTLTSEIFAEITGWKYFETIKYKETGPDFEFYLGGGMYVHPCVDEIMTGEELGEFLATWENPL